MGDDVGLAILRSDGGLASARASSESPVNLLLSGPAGGVAGCDVLLHSAVASTTS